MACDDMRASAFHAGAAPAFVRALDDDILVLTLMRPSSWAFPELYTALVNASEEGVRRFLVDSRLHRSDETHRRADDFGVLIGDVMAKADARLALVLSESDFVTFSMCMAATRMGGAVMPTHDCAGARAWLNAMSDVRLAKANRPYWI